MKKCGCPPHNVEGVGWEDSRQDKFEKKKTMTLILTWLTEVMWPVSASICVVTIFSKVMMVVCSETHRILRDDAASRVFVHTKLFPVNDIIYTCKRLVISATVSSWNRLQKSLWWSEAESCKIYCHNLNYSIVCLLTGQSNSVCILVAELVMRPLSAFDNTLCQVFTSIHG